MTIYLIQFVVVISVDDERNVSNLDIVITKNCLRNTLGQIRLV